MAKIYTTAQGRHIDIDTLRVANEETIAVGNMKVNARGDKLGSGGRVSETRNQIQDEYHKLSTPVPQEISYEEQAAVVKKNAASGARMTQGAPAAEISEAAPVVAPEVVAPVTTTENPVPNLRSSLAASLATPTTVKQEPAKPTKATGPSRI